MYNTLIESFPERKDALNYERNYLNTPSEIYARMM
jgi:hypothetical protein